MKLSRPAAGKVRLTHTQTIRQSASYNSMEATYGIERVVEDNPEAIVETYAEMEAVVEEHLSAKALEHNRLLRKLGAARRD